MIKPEDLTAYRRNHGHMSMESLAIGLGMAKSQIVNLEQGHTEPRRIHALALIGLGVITTADGWKPRQPTDDEIAAALADVIADKIPRHHAKPLPTERPARSGTRRRRKSK